MYPYGLIGNCQASALIHKSGSIHWFSVPHPDSPPIFGRLLDPDGGEFSIESAGQCECFQHYLTNTNVLVTTVTDAGSSFQITDFCPRFEQHGRLYRPTMLFRIVERLSGSPLIRVKYRPVEGWNKAPAKLERGAEQVVFEVRGESLRLVTTMSLTHLSEETAFELNETLTFGLSFGAGIEGNLATLARDYLERTQRYWRVWVKHCSIPSTFQKHTIRSALALKLHCYEDTGAILAAMSTSLPEEHGGIRNWDYRFCWLRDSYFTLSAFHRLGHFEEMEGFLKFLLGIVHSFDRVRPVYRIDGTLPLPEYSHEEWIGFAGSRPVHSNNEAANHIQNDVFGEMVLALAPIYFDERFEHLRNPEHEKLLVHLALQCEQSIQKPDTGLWELRHGIYEHTFTNLMCWAGLDRVVRLTERGFLRELPFDPVKTRERAQMAVQAAARDGALRTGPSDPSFDAAMLQAPILHFPDPDLCRNTVVRSYEALRLRPDGHSSYFLYRYKKPDDFGVPRSAFLLCSFWWVQALAGIGDTEHARTALAEVVKAANHLGLLAEHYSPFDGQQLGNFPQAYSHVGEINAAFAVSPPWEEVL